MKTIILLMLCLIILLGSACSQTINLSSEEIEMYTILLNKTRLCRDWGFYTTNTDDAADFVITSLLYDLVRLSRGTREENLLSDVHRNAIVYSALRFAITREEAFAYTDIPETTLVVWPSERTQRTLEWFNLMAHVPRNQSSHNHVRNRDVEVAETLLEYFPEYGFTWPISMADVINNPEGMARLWARVYIPSDRATITNYARNHEPPTYEEFMKQVEEGQWRWRW